MDCLAQLGWLQFDTTHMGEPDGYLLTPCCVHGYRGVYSPRFKLEWHRVMSGVQTPKPVWTGGPRPTGSGGSYTIRNARRANQLAWDRLRAKYEEELALWEAEQASGSYEKKWNWTDATGGDQASYFTREQIEGREGSWVLVAGAQASGPNDEPVDAQAKWWITTQTDVDTIEEEADPVMYGGDLLAGAAAGYLGGRYGDNRGGGDYLGREFWWRVNRRSHATKGNYIPQLKRWTKEHQNSGFMGHGTVALESEGGRPFTTGREAERVAGGTAMHRAAGGISDPGLGESSGLPTLPGGASRSSEAGSFSRDTVWWVKYGNRNFLGIVECADGIGTDQDRDDHNYHGDGSNWRGTGSFDPDINTIIPPDAQAAGGYIPKLNFWAGDVRGVQGLAQTDADGNIIGAVMTDPGATVFTDLDSGTSPTPPNVGVSMPGHYQGFSATALITTEPEQIKSVLPGLFKTKEEMMAEICDGYNDPIAQTFLINGNAHQDGVFINSVDICFQSKPAWGTSVLPVYLEIRPTINGFPHAEKIIVSKLLDWDMTKVAPGYREDLVGILNSTDPTSDPTLSQISYPNFNQDDAYTKFSFNYPVYLEPGEYAIVIRSNDSNYKCWIADTRGEAVVNEGSLMQFADELIQPISTTYSKQYGGTFFRSQNGRTWTPDQYQDLMFRINRCEFGGASKINPETGTLKLGGDIRGAEFEYDRLKLNTISILKPDTDSTRVSGTLKTITVSSGDTTPSAIGGEVGKVFGEKSEDTRDMPEPMKYIASKQPKDSSIQVEIELSTENRKVSPVIDTRNINAIPLKNLINDGSLSTTNIQLQNGGSGYAVNDTIEITGGGSTEKAIITITAAPDGTILEDGFSVTTAGKGFHHSENVAFTYKDDGGGSGTGAIFEVLSEEGTEGGNSLTRYVTRPINLATGMTARGLKVFLTAQQSYGSRIYVYHKVLAEEDSEDIKRKKWKLMKQTTPDADYFSGSASTMEAPTAISGGLHEYVFDSDELITYTTNDGNTYDSFKTFAIKIVMQASNTSKPPLVNDFRAIAVF